MKQEWADVEIIEREDELVREWDFAQVALAIITHPVMMPFGKIEWDNSGDKGHFGYDIVPLEEDE